MPLGIHGRPFVAWDGVNGPFKTGYCTHGSILFPTWHRPYLALFEVLGIPLSDFDTMLTKYSKSSGTTLKTLPAPTQHLYVQSTKTLL